MCERESYARSNDTTKSAENLWGSPGGQGGCFFKWGPAAHILQPPKSEAKPPWAAKDGPVSQFKKFLFEKVGTGMYYVHAKNIGCNPHSAAAAAETAPKPPNTHLWADFQNLFSNGHRSPPAAKPRILN